MPSVSIAQHNAMEAAAHGNSTLGIPQAVGREFVAADADPVPTLPSEPIEPPETRFAAGLMIIAEGKILFVRRGPGANDHAGEWAFPGGGIEEGETAEEAALRETKEETGRTIRGPVKLWTRRKDADGVDFTAFAVDHPKIFDPSLCDEHDGFVWAAPEDAPVPLHPGCRIALDRIGMHELDIARAMAAGELTSPQRYINVSLFDIRITGTKTAYRRALSEFVYRDPAIYLSDEFLARCNGLPVIWVHPPKNMLNSKEFGERVVGTVFLPYIKGDEVWAIAKIYDDDAIEEMSTKQMSTSPGVLINPSENNILSLDGKNTLLIEGNLKVLDHIAICEVGVWDKGGDPAGVVSEIEMGVADKADKSEGARGDAENDDKTEDKDTARGDSDVMAKLDSICERMDSMSTRMDAFEKRGDADDDKDENKDKKEEKEEARGDAAVATVDLSGVNADLAAIRADLDRRIPAILSDADLNAIGDAQTRADSVFQLFGESAPRPMQGETPLGYRRRVAGKLQTYSPTAKDIDLQAIGDSNAAALDLIEKTIYGEAEKTAMTRGDSAPGVLREIRRADKTGRNISTFVGDTATTWAGFRIQPRSARIIGPGSQARGY